MTTIRVINSATNNKVINYIFTLHSASSAYVILRSGTSRLIDVFFEIGDDDSKILDPEVLFEYLVSSRTLARQDDRESAK